MKKKKILFIINSLEGGGAEKVLIDMLNHFDYSQFDVELLLIRKIICRLLKKYVIIYIPV